METIELSERAFELVNKWGDILEGESYTFEEIAEAGRYFAAFKTASGVKTAPGS